MSKYSLGEIFISHLHLWLLWQAEEDRTKRRQQGLEKDTSNCPAALHIQGRLEAEGACNSHAVMKVSKQVSMQAGAEPHGVHRYLTLGELLFRKALCAHPFLFLSPPLIFIYLSSRGFIGPFRGCCEGWQWHGSVSGADSCSAVTDKHSWEGGDWSLALTKP